VTREVVTVGLPFAQTPRPFLEMAIRSVFAQSIQNWELLLLADGSFPELEERVSQIRDGRVRLISDSRNLGLAARLNQVAAMAAGDVVFRMDGDDLMHPRRLELTLSHMRNPDAEVVGGRAYAIDNRTCVLGLFREAELPSEPAGFLRSNAFTHPTVAARRQWFVDNPYDENLRRSEDKDLWLRTARHSKFLKIDQELMFYRLADLSASKQARDARYDRLLLRRHGPALVGSRRTATKLATSYAKQTAFAGLNAVGRRSVILSRKVTSLNPSAMRAARAALEAARVAPVPGWPDEVLPGC
jgi:glycosyltransferase involved in cell wall biosynthesis